MVNAYIYNDINGRKGITPLVAKADTAGNGENFIADYIPNEKGGYGAKALLEAWEKKTGGFTMCIHHTIYDKVGIDTITEMLSNRKIDNKGGINTEPHKIAIEIKFRDEKLVLGSDSKKSERLTLSQVYEMWITLSRLYKLSVVTPAGESEAKIA